MWTLLGLPAATIAVPFWPAGPTPAVADGTPTAPLCDEANRLHAGLFRFIGDPATGRVQEYLDSYELRSETGTGIWARILPAEKNVFDRTEEMLAVWRAGPEPPSAAELRAKEGDLAAYAYDVLRSVKTADEYTGKRSRRLGARAELPQPVQCGHDDPLHASRHVSTSCCGVRRAGADGPGTGQRGAPGGHTRSVC